MDITIIDIVLAITAVAAVCISIVSMSFAKNFSKRQIEHNKNSVLPICSIYHTNYANFISVRIENNGTGPLIIKNLRCIHKDETTGVTEESQTLFELLPEEIKKEKFYRVFARAGAEKLSITAGKKLFLLSISLSDNVLVETLRNRLKNITVCVEYTDIYGTIFSPELSELKLFQKNIMVDVVDVENYNIWN